MNFPSSKDDQASSSPDREPQGSSSRFQSSHRTPFVPKSPSTMQNTQFSLSFLDVLNSNEAKIKAIFNVSLPENSEQSQLQRDLWLYLFKIIKTKTYSRGFSSSTNEEPMRKKKKEEAHSIPLQIQALRKQLRQWEHLQGDDGRIGHALEPHELHGLIKSAYDTIFRHYGPTPSSPGHVQPSKNRQMNPPSSLSSM